MKMIDMGGNKDDCSRQKTLVRKTSVKGLCATRHEEDTWVLNK